jgi:hypothetical protein
MAIQMPRDGAIIFAALDRQALRAVQVRAIRGVAENQESESTGCYTRNRWDFLTT